MTDTTDRNTPATDTTATDTTAGRTPATSAPDAGMPAVRGARLPSLTGMRWWAALAVFVLHTVVFLPVYPFYGSDTYWTIAKAVPMQVGAAGVTFFFVLSGFIMLWTRRPGDTPRAFIWRRVKKIYPTHLVAVATLVLVLPVPLGKLVTWLPTTALVQTWWPNWTSLGGLNIPAWSLCSEMLFYLTFPFLVPLIERIADRLLPMAIGVMFALIVALHTCYYLFADGYKGTGNMFGARMAVAADGTLPTTTREYGYNADPAFFAHDFLGYADHGYWLSYYFPLSRLPEFFLGVLVARLVISGRWRNTRLWWPLAALAVSFAATSWVPSNFSMSVLILLPTAAVIATACVRDATGHRGLNATGPMVWLGDISYAFYLMQYPVMVIVVKYLLAGHAVGFTGWLCAVALCFVLSLVAAGLVYEFVDKPITRRPRAKRRRKAAAPVPESAR